MTVCMCDNYCCAILGFSVSNQKHQAGRSRHLSLHSIQRGCQNSYRYQRRSRMYDLFHDVFNFYSASALLAMQSAVLARGILSVCPSVTFRYCVQTNEDTIVQFSASGRTIPLVSTEVKFSWYSQGITPSGGVKVRHPSIDRENSTNNRP